MNTLFGLISKNKTLLNKLNHNVFSYFGRMFYRKNSLDRSYPLPTNPHPPPNRTLKTNLQKRQTRLHLRLPTHPFPNNNHPKKRFPTNTTPNLLPNNVQNRSNNQHPPSTLPMVHPLRSHTNLDRILPTHTFFPSHRTLNPHRVV